MGNGTMRIFIAVGLVTVGIFAAAGSLAPIAAQEGATAANPYHLPPTHFGSENPQAVHAFDVAPGFADAPVADNPQEPDAQTVGQQVCTARAEERRVGKESVSTCRFRGSQYNEKK